jgi:hypothetical protein
MNQKRGRENHLWFCRLERIQMSLKTLTDKIRLEKFKKKINEMTQEIKKS